MTRTLRSLLDVFLMFIAPDERGSYFIKNKRRSTPNRDKETDHDR